MFDWIAFVLMVVLVLGTLGVVSCSNRANHEEVRTHVVSEA